MKKKNFILVIFALSIFLFVSFQTTDFQSDTKSISKIDENPNILFANIPFQVDDPPKIAGRYTL